jgi:hypothetical protein
MAISINNVYQKVLTLANKEQRGYITPQEFNLIAQRAQNEIYDNYFHKIKITEAKPKTQEGVAFDSIELIRQRLQEFQNFTTITQTASDQSLDTTSITNLYHINNIINQDLNVELTQLTPKQILYTENNPLTKASTKRPVYVYEKKDYILLYPTPTVETIYRIDYYITPVKPAWGYVVINGNALYNPNASTDFTLHASEEENLISRILILSGTTIKQPELQQAGAQDMALVNQQQNN